MNYIDPSLIVYLLALGGGVFALVSSKKLQVAYRWLGIYLLAAGILQLVGSIIYRDILHISNTPLFNFAIFLYHFILFMVFYYLSERKATRNIIIILFGISTLVLAYLIIHQIPAYQLSMKAVVLESFIYAVCAMLSLLEFMLSAVAENPIKNSRFIALSGILFYFSASAFSFAGRELIQEVTGDFYNYINVVLMFLFYSILILAIYMNKKRNLSSDNS